MLPGAAGVLRPAGLAFSPRSPVENTAGCTPCAGSLPANRAEALAADFTRPSSLCKRQCVASLRRSSRVHAARVGSAGRAVGSGTSGFLQAGVSASSDGGTGGPNGRGPHPPGGSGGSGPGDSGDLPDGSGRGRMKPLTIVFGLFVLVGGVMGYKKKRSKDSLIASSIIAGLLLFSSYLMGKPNTTYGIRLALVTTGSLAAYMGKGYYDKRKVFPQGVLAVLSTVMTIAYVGSL